MKIFGSRKKAVLNVPDSSKMQSNNTSDEKVVLNIEQVQEKEPRSVGGSKSFATHMQQVGTIEDLSLTMSDDMRTDEEDKSLNLDALREIEEKEEKEEDADSAAFSESANSSANFSFTNDSKAGDEAYPALYAPEKQKEYEEEKMKKEKYGMFYSLAPVLDMVSNGLSKVYGSISAYVSKMDIDKLCGGTKQAS